MWRGQTKIILCILTVGSDAKLFISQGIYAMLVTSVDWSDYEDEQADRSLQ